MTVNAPVTPTVSIAAVPAGAICAGTSVTFTATPTNGGTPTYQWKKGGVDIAGETNSTYTTTTLANGDQITVVMTSSLTCVTTSTATSNQITMTVSASPTISNAGGNQAICLASTATLAANTPTIGTGAWSVFSGPSTLATQFSNVADPAAVFTPAGGAGSYVLTWTISNAPCTASTSNVTITVNAPPTASNAGSMQTICANASATLAANTPVSGTGAWTVFSGPSTATSQFSSTTNPTATFTPAGGAGAYVLTWTISNAPCTASSSNVTINVDAVPTSANAGADQGVCGTSTSLAGNTPTIGTGAWSITSGAGGTVAATNNPTSNFTGTVGTAYTLRWTITNGVCTSFDDVNIVFSASPTTANAGSDQAVCGTSATLAGNTPATGAGSWSIISGLGGSVTTPTSPTSTFTGTAGTTYQLRWTISNGACTPSTDDVNITLDKAPTTANAGSDQNLCNTTIATLAGNVPSVGTGNWSVVSGTATITTPSSATSGVTGLTAGTATLRWTISNGSCTASTDDVDINVSALPTTANAGTDQSLCNVTVATLAGNTPTTGTGAWTVVSGTATITTPSSPTSGVTGLTTGTATLRWTISNGSCTASADDVDIVVSAPPTTAAAGGDQTVCGPATLAANTPVVGIGAWSVVSGVGGSFSNTSSPTTTFSGTGGVTYTIRWTISSGACVSSTDDVDITFDINSPTPSNAGPDQNICGTSATLAANTPVVGIGAWSIVSGTGGAIANAANPASGFTGTQGTAYTLRWTITNSTCTPSTDDVVITFDLAPTTSNAGPDQTVCNTNVTLAANAPTTGTGAWSVVSGTGGLFANSASPTSGFTGTQGTAYQLRWTISNGSCTASTDDVNITLDQAPTTADAGSDQNLCNVTVTTLAGNTPTTGTGSWSVVSGTATITTASSPTSGVTGLVVGSATLRWTISNGSCTASTDDVVINVSATPTTAAAGPDQTPCGPATLAANTATVGTGAWSVVSGAGGSFSDATSPTSTFSGTAGTTYQLRWTISNGACAPSTDDVQIQFDINTPTTSNAGPDQTVCGTSATLAANTPTSGTGAWTVVTGAGGSFANAASPTSGFTGTVGTAYTLRWTITTVGGCTPSTDDVSITLDQTPTIAAAGADQSGCSTSLTLAGNSPTVGTGTWSIVSGSGGSLANASSPTSGFTGSSGNTYTLRWTITNGSCTASTDDVTITINPAGSCGGTNCGAFTILASDTRPTCSGQDDGTITINVSGGSPNYVLTLSDASQSFSQALAGPGPFTFTNLSPSLNYKYTVLDVSSNTCTLPYSLPIQTNVNATASGFVDAQCYNQAVGQAVLTVTSGGTSPYEYSLDAGTTWVSFTSPATITNLMPAALPYSILVRDDATDQCPAQVTVSINNAVTDIQITSSSTDATCANNDGSVQITSVSGGSGSYTYQFDGVGTTNLLFSGLAAGNYTFTVVDANNCTKNFPFTISSPGYANFTTQITNPTCTGGGQDGKIDVTISTPGNFDIGITTDPNNDPSPFQFLGRSNISTPVQFSGLTQGTYRVIVKPNGAFCSTPQVVVINSGPAAVDFNFRANNFVCYETKGTVDVFSIKGSTSVDYSYEIINTGNIIRTGTITQLQTLDTVRLPLPQTGLDKGNYQVRVFQDQSLATGCATPISSGYKDFSINGPTLVSFDTLSVVRSSSQYSLATGSMSISIQNTFAPKYQMMLKLIAPEVPGQTNQHNAFDSQWINQPVPLAFNAKDLYAGLYQLSIRDSIGCLRTYALNINLDTQIFIPNLFTPNNDGKNDNFEILYLPDNSSIIIINRWGKQVFASGNFAKNSDGITSIVWNGGAEVDGVYYYTLNTPGKTYTGWVEVMRGSK